MAGPLNNREHEFDFSFFDARYRAKVLESRERLFNELSRIYQSET